MNVRRIVSIIIVIIVLALSILWIVKSIDTLNQKEKATDSIKELTRIMKSFKPVSDNTRELNYSKPTILIYFNSECEHCHEEFEDLKNSIADIRNIQICLVSYQQFEVIRPFVAQYQLTDYSNIFIFQINPDKVLSTFGSSSVPQVFTYRQNTLLKAYKGKTNLKMLIRTLGV